MLLSRVTLRHALQLWRGVTGVLYVKGRADVFFWPQTPRASIILLRQLLCEMVASFPALCLMAQGAPLQYR